MAKKFQIEATQNFHTFSLCFYYLQLLHPLSAIHCLYCVFPVTFHGSWTALPSSTLLLSSTLHGITILGGSALSSVLYCSPLCCPISAIIGIHLFQIILTLLQDDTYGGPLGVHVFCTGIGAWNLPHITD